MHFTIVQLKSLRRIRGGMLEKWIAISFFLWAPIPETWLLLSVWLRSWCSSWKQVGELIHGIRNGICTHQREGSEATGSQRGRGIRSDLQQKIYGFSNGALNGWLSGNNMQLVNRLSTSEWLFVWHTAWWFIRTFTAAVWSTSATPYSGW